MKIKMNRTKAPRRIKPVKRRCIEEQIRIRLTQITVPIEDE